MLFPKHRADLIHSAVAAERMVAGLIEELQVPANPLDVLAQQTVAAVALGEVNIDEWFDTVRRSAPFASLPRSAYEATLDLLSGKYPSDEFAELRPRIVWDRVHGTLTGRPGAQRLAVTSGGTIPDRGLFGVFMVGEKAARVGELDEEMVYESRVGDVFALGATSWRIEDITHDRVLVSPAYGQPGRVPFWKGDGIGRPAELGRAIGAYTRELSTSSEQEATARVVAGGLDERAAKNLLAFLTEQRDVAGHVPTDTTLVVERFRDELGDWRLILHSPYGMRVHAPGPWPSRRASATDSASTAPPWPPTTASSCASPTPTPNPGCRPVHVRARRPRRHRHRGGRRVGTVLVPLPGVRRTRPPAAALQPGQAVAALAAAAAGLATARRRSQVPDLPDRARGGPRGPARRLRPPGADAADRRAHAPRDPSRRD
ncbi:hypothetical protein GCM10025867_11810 [Frondihabitans sucicola]|uniref:DEAD/DEAH box helicase n=1 Tax=Frondihabitans sucicola TaxID=1268041 RepID=A0ABN6XV89_9MICO|nr:hypothetical protein GCM10025867_11810 [Frondihabitans sucicola]